MKKDGLLNPQILSAIAAIGHTEYLVIADAGLPVPSGIPVIDISLIRGIPDFGVVLCSVIDEMVVESFIQLQKRWQDKSQDTYGTVIEALPQVPFRCIAQRNLRKAAKAKGSHTDRGNNTLCQYNFGCRCQFLNNKEE